MASVSRESWMPTVTRLDSRARRRSKELAARILAVHGRFRRDVGIRETAFPLPVPRRQVHDGA